MGNGTIYFVMGVSGCGKSTLGKALASDLGVQFLDADDFHPPANIRKMSQGMPLTDADRWPWLDILNAEALRSGAGSGAVIGCSALKESYRQRLQAGLPPGKAQWICLVGSFEEISGRLRARQGHFMPPALLRSQFESLEEPTYGIRIPVGFGPPEAMVAEIRRLLEAGGDVGSGV